MNNRDGERLPDGFLIETHIYSLMKRQYTSVEITDNGFLGDVVAKKGGQFSPC